MHSVTVFGLVILVLSIGHVLGESIPDPPLCPEVVDKQAGTRCRSACTNWAVAAMT